MTKDVGELASRGRAEDVLVRNSGQSKMRRRRVFTRRQLRGEAGGKEREHALGTFCAGQRGGIQMLERRAMNTKSLCLCLSLRGLGPRCLNTKGSTLLEQCELY